mmetsp:Transcript_21415/g.61075  ORF Transcript_21415/g.61075 Transcript_21415/m.61075 type:complete len:223 (-) Transcript_21415:785-1453(-)
MVTFNPVSGSLIALSSSVIAPSKLVISVFLVMMSSPVTVRSLSHQLFCCLSASSSLAMRAMILSISAKTTSNGLFACNMPRTRCRRGDLAAPPAFCRNSLATCCWLVTAGAVAVAIERCARCRRTAARCTKEVGPEEAAVVAPKLSNAASEFRMEMASDKAACSAKRSFTRWSYSFFFSEHMNDSLSRNSCAAAIWSNSPCSSIVLVLKMLSFSPISPCFVL